MGKLELTKEQKEIIKAVKGLISQSKKSLVGLKINAYAGTGKTTTLLEIVKDNPDKRFLLLAFNKSVKEEISKKKKKEGLKNLSVYTLHGLAYNSLFRNLLYKKSKPQRLTGRSSEIFESIQIHLYEKISEIWENQVLENHFIYFICRIFDKFCSSQFIPHWTSEQLNEYYYNLGELRFYLDSYRNKFIKENSINGTEEEKKEVANEFNEKLIKSINLIWEYTERSIRREIEGDEIVDLEGLDEIFDIDTDDVDIDREEILIKYSHEAYLKYFHKQLWKGEIRLNRYYDILMIDEAQDVNGLNAGIINAMELPTIIVGDRHQNIYNWRGTLNLFGYYKNWKGLYLTTSFRFKNEKIVEYANAILKEIKGEKKLIKAYKIEKKENIETLAFLSRTNTGLFQVLIDLKEIELKENEDWEDTYPKMVVNYIKNFKNDVMFIKTTRDLSEIISPVKIGVELYKALKRREIRIINTLKIPRYIKETLIEILKNPNLEEENLDEILNSVKALLTKYEEFDLRNSLTIIQKNGLGSVIETLEWIEEKKEKKEIGNKLRKKKGIITLSTIHTAKGLEWDYVYLTEDILPISEDIKTFLLNEYSEDTLINPTTLEEVLNNMVKGIREDKDFYKPLIEEINLKYVALTRAKIDFFIANFALEEEILSLKKEGLGYILEEVKNGIANYHFLL